MTGSCMNIFQRGTTSAIYLTFWIGDLGQRNSTYMAAIYDERWFRQKKGRIEVFPLGILE